MRLLPADLHRAGRPSLTAQWTTLGRALELAREPSARIVSDPLAPLFLDRVHTQLLHRATTGPARSMVQTMERSPFAAIATSALCRHRVLDAALLESLPEIEQVVILGAGYDTRAHRFAHALGTRPVFEVDLAPLSRQKAAIVAAHPDRFRSRRVVRVETDFADRPLRSSLLAAGFRPGAPSFVAWEGVSMYLDRAAVASTLADVASVCGAGSALAMDFFAPVPGLRPADAFRRVAAGSLRLIGEPIRFTPAPSEARSVLADAGAVSIEVVDADQLTRRVATGRRACDPALYVTVCRF